MVFNSGFRICNFRVCILMLILFVDSLTGISVTVDVSGEDFNDLPESLTVTFEVTQNVPVRLHLQRISDIDSNLPVYLVSRDSNGNIQKQRQEPSDLKTVGYYQDVNMQANIKITLTKGDKNATLEGEFRYKGRVYSIKPSSREKRDTGGALYDVHEKQAQRHFGHMDYIPLADKSSKFIKRPTSYNTRRHERATIPTYYIDVVAAVDKTMYDIFLTRAGSQQTISTDIREYFSFVFNGVDLSYRSITWTSYRINVRLIKIVIFSKTDVYRVIYDAKKEDYIESNLSLESFSELVNSASGVDLFAPYDHVMLFVGQSMIVGDGELLGLAYMSTVCRNDGQSTSIIYDAGTYSSILTSAHELGHSLSAEHDGEGGNRCHFEDRYIMAASDSESTQGTELHPWIFSNCSVANFTNLFKQLLQTSRGKMCLNTKLFSADSYDVKSYLGQRYPPDQQCQRRQNKTDVVFYRNLHDTDLCLNLYCSYEDYTSYYLKIEPAYYGTSCASGKVCKQGECVADPTAPTGDDYCMFGEKFSGCASLVQRFKGNCYNATYRHICCQTCQSAYETVEGCEFGDKRDNCTLSDCNRSDPKFAEECCGTCHYGTTFTTTASPTKTTTSGCPGDTSQDCTDSVCTSTNSTAVMECCATCDLVTLTTTKVLTCQDDPQFKSQNGNCLTSVWFSTSACYNQTVQRSCCASCASADVGIIGCVYGDKKTGCDEKSCRTSKSDCCETCEGFNKATQLHENVFLLTVICTSYLL